MKKEEELQQGIYYVIARRNFKRWNQMKEHKKSSVK
jgi:hypothetical protein